MGIGSNEFRDVTAKAVDQLGDKLDRIDKRLAMLLGVDALEPRSSPDLDRIRQYVAEVRAAAEYEAGRGQRELDEREAHYRQLGGEWQAREDEKVRIAVALASSGPKIPGAGKRLVRGGSR